MTGQLWPPVVDPRTLTRQVWNGETARSLPGVGRILSLYGGLIGQMLLDRVNGTRVVSPRPRVLEQPDPELDLPTFIASGVEDFLLNGNAAWLVTTRDSTGYPSSLKWYPSWAWSIVDVDGACVYYLHGTKVPDADVVHVRRGQDPWNVHRGVGIVEQHLRTLNRAGLQEEYESSTLQHSGVPSVAVIAPQKDLTQKEADDAGDSWVDKFSGPVRRPGIFPAGTQIQTLSWSPSDQQLVLARQLTSTDLANLANLDPYWLGAPGSSHTYRSAGSMFVALLRVSLEPVLAPFEDVWSRKLVPAGSRVRFDRVPLTRDDMATMVTTGVQAVNAGLITVDEWRGWSGLTPFSIAGVTDVPRAGALPAAPTPTDAPAAEPDVTIAPPTEG